MMSFLDPNDPDTINNNPGSVGVSSGSLLSDAFSQSGFGRLPPLTTSSAPAGGGGGAPNLHNFSGSQEAEKNAASSPVEMIKGMIGTENPDEKTATAGGGGSGSGMMQGIGSLLSMIMSA